MYCLKISSKTYLGSPGAVRSTDGVLKDEGLLFLGVRGFVHGCEARFDLKKFKADLGL